jgi:ABC-2 type transport system ATP-binding protein
MRREFHEYIRALRQGGRSILLTTHDLDEVAQLCDRIAVIDRGRIVATGSPGDLIASLRSAARVSLVADRTIDCAWLKTSAMFTEVRCKGAELSFTTTDSTMAVARLCAVFAEHGVQIVQLTVGSGTLEDAILEIIASNVRTESR